MVYVFDIDGTICTSTNSEYEKAEPLKERIKKVNDIYEDGHTVIFLTARGMGRSGNSSAYANMAFYELTKKQLDSWGVKHHALFLGKPAGDFYIDDKGINDSDFFAD
jgi:hydroxymethylpyrimidine pyrophosphatase-like HAD family hydrolase